MRKTLLDCDKLKESSIEYRPGTVEGVDLREPFVMDSMNGAVPPEAYEKDKTLKPGMRKVTIPDLPSMTKMFFIHHRNDLIAKLQDLADMGVLQKIVGYEFLKQRFNRGNCIFGWERYYRIDRTHFYMEMPLTLHLKDIYNHHCEWKGNIRLSFDYTENSRSFGICNIGHNTLAESGLIKLESYLIPVMTNKQLDEFGEEMWMMYDKDAYYNRGLRSPAKLANLMGLNVLNLPVHDSKGLKSTMFFKESRIYVKSKDEDDDSEPRPFIVPANTIVVNTNVILSDYSEFYIYHECIHYELHYLFFASQDAYYSSISDFPTKTKIVREYEEVKDPIHFIEQQADRGAYALMLPFTETKYMLNKADSQVVTYKHAGERYEQVGMSLVRQLTLPRFRVRARMLQLGIWEAKGCLNFIDNHPVPPYAYARESVADHRVVFSIELSVLNNLCYKDEKFRGLMNSGKYVYAESHVVLNDRLYVVKKRDKYYLTEEARAHVDECCIRFIRIYVRTHEGKYVLGRLNYDADSIKWSLFYLEETMKENDCDIYEARRLYKQKFPKDFDKIMKQLMKQYKISQSAMAEEMNITRDIFTNSIVSPKVYRNVDYLTVVSLILKLPDWLSTLLFKRARVQFDDENERDEIIQDILRYRSADGVAAARHHLKEHNQKDFNY